MYLVKVSTVSTTSRLIHPQCVGRSQTTTMEAWMIEAVECPTNVPPATSVGHTVALVPTVCLDAVLEHPSVENGLDRMSFCVPPLEHIELEHSWEAVRLNPILVVAKLEDFFMDCKF